MEIIKENWHGFERLSFDFEDRKAILVKPKEDGSGGRWLLKTEYFGAFPEFELSMLKLGYHVAFVSNKTRWHDESDDGVKYRFCEFLAKNFSLCEKCMPVGFSCGGMHAIYFAAAYPERVAAMYLDAPVVNLLSCPAGVGRGTSDMFEEFKSAKNMTLTDLINYRDHPIDNIAPIAEHNIPIFLVGGDSDDIVPFEENGEPLYRAFRALGGNIVKILKPGCNHHPHGLSDNAPIIDFALKYYS